MGKIQDFVWNVFIDNEYVIRKGYVLQSDYDMLDVNNENLIDEYEDKILELTEEIIQLNDDLEELEVEIEQYDTANELEEYWNNKRDPNNWVYPGRPNPEDDSKRMYVDPRIFFQKDHLLPTYSGSNDEIANNCLKYVNHNITYTSDVKSGGEYWQFAYETLKRKKGDCEDGAILMANMMVMSGIPYWRVRLNAGDVQGGGHAYVTYLREEDNQWYVMDWCYWYSESVNYKKTWHDAEKYFGIWGSWNSEYVFGDLPKELEE